MNHGITSKADPDTGLQSTILHLCFLSAYLWLYLQYLGEESHILSDLHWNLPKPIKCSSHKATGKLSPGVFSWRWMRGSGGQLIHSKSSLLPLACLLKKDHLWGKRVECWTLLFRTTLVPVQFICCIYVCVWINQCQYQAFLFQCISSSFDKWQWSLF